LERVVDLVRDPGGQRANCGQFFRVAEDLLRGDKFRSTRLDFRFKIRDIAL